METTSSNKMFPLYNGPLGPHVYGNIPVVKIPSPPDEISPDLDIDINKKHVITSNFWLDNPKTLIETFDIIPNVDMTLAERLNAMTRVVIALSAILFLIRFELWWLFLTIGIIVVIALWHLVNEDVYKQREYLRKPILRPVNKIIQPISKNLGKLKLIPRIR